MPASHPSQTPHLGDAEAVARLFDLAMQGDPGNAELQRLDEIVYGRLLRTYAVGNDDEAAPQAATVRC